MNGQWRVVAFVALVAVLMAVTSGCQTTANVTYSKWVPTDDDAPLEPIKAGALASDLRPPAHMNRVGHHTITLFRISTFAVESDVPVATEVSRAVRDAVRVTIGYNQL